jgi:dethiobiotin synthetase
VVARAGLGTINHSALTVEALAQRGLSVVAVVLNQNAAEVDASSVDNAAEIARLTGVPVLEPLPYVANARERRDQISRRIVSKMDPLRTLA